MKSRSSAAALASEKHKQQYGAGAAGSYGKQGHAQYGSYGAEGGYKADSAYSGYPGSGYGHGHGGWGGKAGYGGGKAGQGSKAAYGSGYNDQYGADYGAQVSKFADGYGADKASSASVQKKAALGAYDNDEWAKQAYGQDYDSRYGKSYDSVEARSFDNEHYAREVRADDDQWAEDYDRYDSGALDQYGRGGSAEQTVDKQGKGAGFYGYGKGGDYKGAANSYGADYGSREASDWDAYGRDQDFHEKISYDQTRAKAYAAESYDEWDNSDSDKWGAQAWGKDRDVLGSTSYGKAASLGKYGQYGQQHGYNPHGTRGSSALWEGASRKYGAAENAYDNDEFAKQAYGSDADARFGKSYDSVSARSYDNEKYARWLQADDDQWAEDYDRIDKGDMDTYGNASSVWADAKGYGVGFKGKGGAYDAANQRGKAGYWAKSGSDWDAYGRDQDLEVDESYEATWAKSYDAESYDEWDNKDDDKWGAQAWGKDRDLYGASSEGSLASEGDRDLHAYGKGQTYAGKAYGGYDNQYGAAGAYGKGAKGYGLGGYGGYGSAGAYGANGGDYGSYGKKAYGAEKDYGAASLKLKGASGQLAASMGAYDNDEWAKQAYGSDFDSRYGKSYDRVAANTYDDEQYARKVRADDDQWAEDYDRFIEQDEDQYAAGASDEYSQPRVTKTAYVAQPEYGGYGGYGYYGDIQGQQQGPIEHGHRW
jgi:hypothetical protein